MDNNVKIIRFDGTVYYIQVGKKKVIVPKKAIIDREKPIVKGNILGHDFSLNYSEKSGFYLRQTPYGTKNIFSVSVDDVAESVDTRLLAFVGLGYNPLSIKYIRRIRKYTNIGSIFVYAATDKFLVLEEKFFKFDSIYLYRVLEISVDITGDTIYKVLYESDNMEDALEYMTS